MGSSLALIAFIVVCFLLQTFLLPRMGVPT